MGESNTVVSAYTMYRHFQNICSRQSICLGEINTVVSAYIIYRHLQ